MEPRAVGPAVAGVWYPADGQVLAAEIDTWLSAAENVAPSTGRVAAILAPHAGYAYSGRVAALGFRPVLDGSPERVLLLGPSHRAAFHGGMVPRSPIYRTPLGDVALDDAARAALPRKVFSIDDGPFRDEHALEAEIPFLQRSLEPGFLLLPVLVGGLGPKATAARLAEALRPLIGPQTLVVVSSDFTHFGPRFGYVPFEGDVPRRIEALDRGAIERILAWDVAGFESYVERTGATICGRHAISILLRLFSDPPRGVLAAYDTSGRITGDWDHCVSYASLVFSWPAARTAT